MTKRTELPQSIVDYERLAARRMKRAVWNYVAGGAGDERGLSACREDLDAVRLVSRVLRGIEAVDTTAELLGERVSHPILVAPTAYHGTVHPAGEVETARAAAAFGTVMCLSTLASCDVEDVARESAARLWFQLYFYKDRGITKQLVARAEAAGCRAVLLTVDLPALGVRYRDRPRGFRDPKSSQISRLLEREGHCLKGGADESFLDRFFSEQRNPGLSWKDVEWLRSITKLPVLLKGVLSPEDAKIAARNGVAGLVVSTHGGRQLDALVSPIVALPAIRQAAGDGLTILIDGGIRTGSDVIRCLCLGADGVLLGRPVLWGLAVAGAAGVRHVLDLVGEELKRAMMILGTGRVDELGRSFVAAP